GIEGTGAVHGRMAIDEVDVATATAVHGVDARSAIGHEHIGPATTGQGVGAAFSDQVTAARAGRERIVTRATVEVDKVRIRVGDGHGVRAAVGDELLDILVLRTAELDSDAANEFDHGVEYAIAVDRVVIVDEVVIGRAPAA